MEQAGRTLISERRSKIPAHAMQVTLQDVNDELLKRIRIRMGEDLAILRQGEMLTQSQLGEHLGYHRSAVSHAECGLHDIAREFWEKTDRYFDTGTRFADLHDIASAYIEFRRILLLVKGLTRGKRGGPVADSLN